MERLQKFMASSGVASRRKCEELILAGRVTVNGQPVRELGITIDTSRDEVRLDGDLIMREAKAYLILNKPRGYITSVGDPHQRRTVMELVSDIEGRLFPVGRLDKDTSGLLFFTNDGDLANLMMHPRYELVKTYQARVRGLIRPDSLQRLREGIQLDDGMTAPAQVKLLEHRDSDRTSLVEVKIHEGKNRQVRRMLAAVSHRVIDLERTEVGPLNLEGLDLGAYRYLETEEVKGLYEAINIGKY